MAGQDSTKNQILGLSIVLAGIAMGRMLKQSDSAMYMLRMTPSEIDQHLANHTFLHVGGHHRGGTTIAWDALKCHPLMSEFGTRSDIVKTRFPWIQKVHFEGIFLQDVYPTFSLDHPPSFFWKRAVSHQLRYWFPDMDSFEYLSFRYNKKRLEEGVGSFALNPNSHLTEDHPLATRASAERLLNQWGSLWDLSKPVLLEKSPSNARIPRFLNALWHLTSSPAPPAAEDEDDDELVEEEASSQLGGPRVRFLFMTRHPLMQALAMEAFVDDLSLYQRVEHWLAIEESFARDAHHLPPEATRRVQLERLAASPQSELEGLAQWLGLPGGSGGFDQPELKAWLQTLSSDPNLKYAEPYRAAVSEGGEARAELEAIVRDFADRVAAVSAYDLSMGLLASG